MTSYDSQIEVTIICQQYQQLGLEVAHAVTPEAPSLIDVAFI